MKNKMYNSYEEYEQLEKEFESIMVDENTTDNYGSCEVLVNTDTCTYVVELNQDYYKIYKVTKAGKQYMFKINSKNTLDNVIKMLTSN